MRVEIEEIKINKEGISVASEFRCFCCQEKLKLTFDINFNELFRIIPPDKLAGIFTSGSSFGLEKSQF